MKTERARSSTSIIMSTTETGATTAQRRAEHLAAARQRTAALGRRQAVPLVYSPDQQ